MHLPIISYIRRYYWLLAAIYPLYLFARADSVWRVLDVFSYFPLVFASTAAFALLFRNVFHRKTTDRDVDSGDYALWYRNLPPHIKVWIVTVQWLVYILSGAVISHGLLLILAGLPEVIPS